MYLGRDRICPEGGGKLNTVSRCASYSISLNKREQLSCSRESIITNLSLWKPEALTNLDVWAPLQKDLVIVCYDFRSILQCWKEKLFTKAYFFLYGFEGNCILFLILIVL